MDLFLYNTRSREKELFEPIKSGEVKIYSCGPTVYSDPHIGNLRTYTNRGLLGDVLRNILGYKTTHVVNITDVGHLTDDGDCGEDKLEKGAKKEGISAWDIAKKYEHNFLQYLEQLHVSFDAYPRATDYIKEQIVLVKNLIEKGYTYVIPNDGIYMDTSNVPKYGELLGPNYKEALEGMDVGNRVCAAGKKNPTDFALWKFSPKNTTREMERIFDGNRAGLLLDNESRQTLTQQEQETRGFPGWHIECSAMSRSLLGDTFDIHTGGVDHIAVHHSNEIAQSECAYCGHNHWVNYRLHGQFLNIDGKKLSKSDGDDLSVPGLQERGYSPLDLRYFFLTGQYRNFLDFSWEAMEAAKTTRQNMIKKLYTYLGDRIVRFYNVQKADANDILLMQFTKPLLDDLDTPKFLASLQKALGNLNDEVVKTILYIDKILLKIDLYQGVVDLVEQEREKNNTSIPEDIQQLAQQRREAKQQKDYTKADSLRQQLKEQGRTIEDTAEGWNLVRDL